MSRKAIDIIASFVVFFLAILLGFHLGEEELLKQLQSAIEKNQ